MSTEDGATIVIKRKRGGSGGDAHHGGAWKVAYADFVTAMMALFLLMWLLNATTEKQRKGLADYFSPTIPISRVSSGGDGAFWGDSVFAEDTLAQNGQGASLSHPADLQAAKGDVGVQRRSGAGSRGDNASLEEAEHLLESLRARGGESMTALTNQRHVVTRLSDEGLVIDIFWTPGNPLFADGTSEPTPHLLATLGIVADLLDFVANDVAVNAHLPARPVVVAANPNWELSSARAQSARAALERAGLPAGRVQRVTGFAERKPVAPDPMSARNDRVEIVVLRHDF